MRLVAFSDFHYCHSWPLLDLTDFEAAHKRVCEYALEHRPDLVLFLGDRFRARQPRDHVRALADRQLRALADVQAKHGGEVVYLVGNHDRYSESTQAGNTYSTVDVFRDVLPNVHVVAAPGTFPLANALLHALPSGYCFDRDVFRPDPNRLNIFAFHGLVKGAVFDDLGTVIEDSALSLADLDDSAWDVVLGGDVHVPQRFNLTRTAGGYVGSTLRLTEADADDRRGFLDVALEKGKPPHFEFVEAGGPRIVTVDLGLDRGGWPEPSGYAGVIVLATLSGPAKDLRTIKDAEVVAAFPRARRVKVERRPEQATPAFLPEISAASSPLVDALAYVRWADRSGLDADRLQQKVRLLMDDGPKRKGIF